MVEGKFNTPILFLIFNRPGPTSKVFEEIRKLRPAILYIAADGSRDDKTGELDKCRQTREIINNIDWDCNVKTLFREKNLGCKLAVSSAITWFFENEKEGIILEDDCVPNQSFFIFCADLLEKYRDNDRIMHIGGINLQSDLKNEYSYYFSNYNHVWGWATWKRAWSKYDVDMKDFPEFLYNNKIRRIFGSNLIQYSWLYKFLKVYKNKIDTWDYQWTYSIWNHNGISVIPTKNLVSNIGFDLDATHTRSHNNILSELQTQELRKINHPKTIEINYSADNKSEKIAFNVTYFKKIAFLTIIKLLKQKFIK
jgi:hypothetical protein